MHKARFQYHINQTYAKNPNKQQIKQNKLENKPASYILVVNKDRILANITLQAS